jgi:hypothetical protein
VRDEDHCLVKLVDGMAQEGKDGVCYVRVERCRRLVGEYDLGIGDESPSDRHALSLTAREGVGQSSQLVDDPDLGRYVAYMLALYVTTVEAKRQSDVLGDRKCGHEVERLEDESHTLTPKHRKFPAIEARDIDAAYADAADLGLVEPSRALEQRRLATSGQSHDSGESSVGKGRGDVSQGVNLVATTAVGLADRDDLDSVGS